MTRKNYSADLDEYGRAGEHFVHAKLRESGYAEHHPNGIYNEDILFRNNSGESLFIEVERMLPSRWPRGRDAFPFRPITLVKHRKYGPDRPHVQLSADMTHAYVTFFCDHADAPVLKKPTRFGGEEEFLAVDPERAILWDLSRPIEGSFAEMNYKRTKALVDAVVNQKSYLAAKRALVGSRDKDGKEPFRQPYGCSVDEWREWLCHVSKFALKPMLDPARRSHQKLLTFAY